MLQNLQSLSNGIETFTIKKLFRVCLKFVRSEGISIQMRYLEILKSACVETKMSQKEVTACSRLRRSSD